MRTTLTLDDDVLAAAKGLAHQQGRSLGEVISDLARSGLVPKGPAPKTRNGIPLLEKTSKSQPVTLEVVNQLRDELS
jgi:hypothetical protein